MWITYTESTKSHAINLSALTKICIEGGDIAPVVVFYGQPTMDEGEEVAPQIVDMFLCGTQYGAVKLYDFIINSISTGKAVVEIGAIEKYIGGVDIIGDKSLLN